MNKLLKTYAALRDQINLLGLWVGLLSLRLLLAWEFYESGLEKLHGENWFADIQQQFPFPFNVIPAGVSWQMATWFELIGGIALVLGVATRFFSVSLLVLTLVAIVSVHWPADWHSLAELGMGYALTDTGFGNYKLPAIFIAMLLPLMLLGPGKLSLDYWLDRRLFEPEDAEASA
jgi:putative oxidoreductase